MGTFDKQGNPIGDGRHHVKEHVYEFNEYPQISAKVTKSLTTETTYVKYYNSENGKSITVRFSNHVSNAVLFGDQLNGYTAKRDEILFYLGLKKRTLIPNTRLHIWTQSVAKKKLNDYEYTDKTIGDLYELGEGADISKHKGKIAKGSNYLILGDSVEKVIDKKINSLGQKVVLGEYVYSDISVSDEKFKRGGEITPDVCVNYIKKTESILRNGYYSDHGLFYLITYNSGGGEGLNVYQTVNYALVDKLAFFLGFNDTTVDVMILKHYEDARRFDNLKILKEIKGKPVIIIDRDTIVCSNYDRKKVKLKDGGEVSDEMESFDWNSIYDIDGSHGDSDTKKEPKYDIDKIKSLIDQKIDSEKAVIEDWSNRNYKSNKGIVYTGGDDIHGTPLQIGSINESRRRNKINSAERVISELSLAKDIVEKYRGNESDLYNIVLDDYRKNYYRGYNPKSYKRDYKIEQRYSDAYDVLINTIKESESFKSGGEVNKEDKVARFEKGKKLSESEKREVYATMRDSYKELKRPYTFEDTERGEKKVWIEDSSEYMVKSGITSRMIRWFITLPDGTIAHPTELFPNVTVSEMNSTEKNIEYNERQSELRYNKVVDALKKSGEIGKVVSRIKTAMQNGAEFIDVYDSADIGKKNPFTRLKFRNGSSWSVPQYTISADDSYLGLTDSDLSELRNTGRGKGFLHHELAEIDWKRFLNEFELGGEVNKETKMDKPKNNVALYTRVKGEKQFRASDFKGNQVDRLVNAPLVSPDKFDEFLKAIKQTAEQNKNVDFRIKEFGTNKIWYDSQLSKGTEVESNKHEELPYGEIIIVEHSLKSGANVRDAYITVRKDSPFVIQFKNRHVYCLKFRKINNEEWTFYNVAVGFTKKEFDELKEGSIKHTMENTMKFVSTEKRIIEKLLIYELDYLSEKGYMLAPLFIDTYGTTYSVEKLDDDGYYFVNESFTKRGKQLENNNPISYYADTATTVFEAIDKKYKKAKEDELSKGTKVELEHKDTIEEISSGKLSPEEGAKEIAKDHIDEDPQYYDKLEKVESKTPIKELGTGSKVYFETPFYRVNEYSGSNLNDRFIFTMKAKDDQYGVPLFEHFFADIDIALFVAEKISKIYPNGVPEAALIHRIIKDISGEYKEKQENNMSSTNNELTGVKSIIVNESRPFSNWNEANESTKWLISQQVWSNLPYKIEFQDGFILEGTIDAEPYSFWKDKKNPLTWHLNTFWGNLARATANPIYDQESIDYAKKVVTKYNIGQDISTDVDNSDVTPPESEDAEVVSSAKQDVIKKLLKEKKTAYNFVYDRLLKVAPDLLRLLNEAEYTSDVYGKSQYRTQDFGGNDAFMYLAIEGLDKDEQGRYELSISHYYKQHGDMMCDPCMTVRLDPELKTVEALTFKMDGVIGRGIIKSVYGTTKDGKPGVNLYEKKDQNSFLNKWSSNWVKQGHKVEFRPLPEKEVSGTPISAEAQAVIQPEWDKMQDFLAGKETKASDRKDENEIKREKYPIVVEWSEGSSDENIGFENLEQLEIWLDQIGFTENPDETYIKNKVWFRGMTSYVRIDLSKQKGDFNPKEQSLIEYLIENVSNQFDWQSLSESKKPIVQDANFTYFKGIEANYDNQFKLNKAIEEFLDSKTDDYVYATEEKEFISTYEGYGGLEKQGATGVGLLFEYYTPPKLIEKMWGLAYKYGFSTGKVLEPSVGVGRFLNYTGKTDVVKGYEINPYSAKICRIIHPKANIILSSFAEHFYKGNVFNPKFEKDFDLVIGNPPYGKMTDLRTHGENSRIGVSISQYEHYFILRGLDCLKSGGLLIYVSTANLATKGYEKIKEKIFEKADLVDCYLLPNTTFKQTKVNTSLIVLRRK